MSVLTRYTIAFAILFGCFAALVPRYLLPLIQPEASSSNHYHDIFQHTSTSEPHEHEYGTVTQSSEVGAADLDAADPQISSLDPTSTKTAVKFALPMYAVGIGIFFFYTCCKYWSRRNQQENKIKDRYSTQNIRWNAEQRKFRYDVQKHLSDDDEEENDDDVYAGLDSDYVEYLRSKKQKERHVEDMMNAEQRQMHRSLDEMKESLTFINTKLVTNDTGGSLSNNEISQLQNRLATTEAQMHKLLSALEATSTKVRELANHAHQPLDATSQVCSQTCPNREERHPSSRSPSESELSSDDEQNSNSDDNSYLPDERVSIDHPPAEEDTSSSSYEEEDDEGKGMSHRMEDEEEEDDEDRSESLSGRYGMMDTDYGRDPTTVEDYELSSNQRSDPPHDSRSKVHEWRERNHSQSLSSDSNASVEQDQTIPTTSTDATSEQKT